MYKVDRHCDRVNLQVKWQVRQSRFFIVDQSVDYRSKINIGNRVRHLRCSTIRTSLFRNIVAPPSLVNPISPLSESTVEINQSRLNFTFNYVILENIQWK